jgi:hypothetical protein
MSVRRIGAPIVIAALCALAVPGVASAARIRFDRACYANVPHNAMTIAGTGFTPGDTVDLEAHDVFAAVTVGPAGSFLARAPVPPLAFSHPGDRRFRLTAKSESTSIVAEAPFAVTNFAVSTSPGRAKPTQRVRFTFSGFAPGKPIFGHFVLRDKVRVTHRYGKAKSPCGTLTTGARLYPGRHVRFGYYHVQFDDRRHYSKHSVPRLETTLRIFRTFHL